MAPSQPAVLGFAAFSGTGKTTLLTSLIPILQARGLKVAALKLSHHDFEIDHAGKDSYKLRKAGASPVMLVSPFRRAIIEEFPAPQEIELEKELELLIAGSDDVRIILVEGFRHQRFSKIELHRPALDKPLLYPNDDSIIAIASDQNIAPRPPIPCLNLNDPHAIANFICQHFSLISRD
ncbi:MULTISPECIES: molybdopterin-guanine dinucleotide biosynthesis protein B [Methylomonas]|uniref:molybdopterin-guanine dinucleotide biosynthesis protein B n=1 Tax=Methylomonas TaxID=416 RepID=UPI0012318F61|nr:molybdopterin-guanine dinucleotide biosynthesis protein B [Methylomonas rhizoryzae]